MQNSGVFRGRNKVGPQANCRCCFFQTPSVVHCMNATKFLPTNNFCQHLWVTRKRSCISAGNAQAQLHFRDDQQRAFGISNISNCSQNLARAHKMKMLRQRAQMALEKNS